MKNTKNIFGLALVVGILSLSPITAPAQNVSAVSLGITNTLVAGGTKLDAAACGSAVRIDQQQSCGFLMTYQGDAVAAGTNTLPFVVVTLARSADGTTYETLGSIISDSGLIYTNANQGVTNVVVWRQLPASLVGSAHSIKIIRIENRDPGVNLTNCAAYIVKKDERRRP